MLNGLFTIEVVLLILLKSRGANQHEGLVITKYLVNLGIYYCQTLVDYLSHVSTEQYYIRLIDEHHLVLKCHLVTFITVTA